MKRPAILIGPDLWPEGGATRRMGLIVLTVLSLLTLLGVLGHIGASRAAGNWTRQVTSEATALIRPRADETGATAAARAAEALAGVRGVQEAVALERSEAEALLRPWLGEADLATLPLPQLVAVRLDPREPASAISLNRALAEAGVDGTVDDHSLWREDFTRAAAGLRVLSALGAGLLALLTLLTIVVMVRQAVGQRLPTLQALRLAGADRAALTFLAQWHLGRDALLSGTVALALALVTGLGLALFPVGEAMGRVLPLILSDLLWLLPWPLVLALVAGIAARLSIQQWLGRAGGAH